MKTFANHFSDEEIVGYLCRRRVRDAAQRSKILFHNRISTAAPAPPELDVNESFLPGRRDWTAFRDHKRRRSGTSAAHVNERALFRATLHLRNHDPQPPWAGRLQSKIDGIRSRVVASSFTFQPPSIFYEHKNGNDYRPITSFSGDDKIIDALAARYFRAAFDAAFLPSACAFRWNPTRAVEHPVAQILEYRSRHGGSGLYVAECDLQGFFDCIDHETLLRELHALSGESGTPIDPHGLKIFNAYLRAYSFPRQALETQERLRKETRNVQARFKWPDQRLREFHDDPFSHHIGVPQGGALSGFIANCQLHRADRAVAALRAGGHDFLYLRFCDDMIVLSPSPKTTSLVFETYREQLRFLKLPAHPPENVSSYVYERKRQFWAVKSKTPYLWRQGAMPWIQFLGYQIRHDGMMRVRPTSIQKQITKIQQLANETLATLSHARNGTNAAVLRASPQQILHRFRQKVLSMSVGRVVINDGGSSPRPMCWASGFRLLKGHPFIEQQLKRLDLEREQQIRRVAHRVRQLPPPADNMMKSTFRCPRYFGRPFSYLAQMDILK